MPTPVEILLKLRGQADVAAGLDQIAGAFRGIAGAVVALTGAAVGLETVRRFVSTGIDFNSALEQARLGIAAIQRQASPDKFASFNQAFQAAAGAVTLLEQKAKESPASFQELVTGFQSITGAVTAAGIPLRKQVDLVVLMSQALSGLGIRSDQLTQESRALLTGNIDQNASAAKLLGITADDINRQKEAGTLYEFLTAKLGGFAEAAKAGASSYLVLLSNLKDGIEQGAARATGPLFDRIKDALQSLNNLDLSGFGERIGAAVQLAIDQWESGRFDEFVALTIEAGFEVGLQAAEQLFAKLSEWLGKPAFWAGFGNIALTTVNGITKAVASGLSFALSFVAGYFLKEIDVWRFRIEGLAEIFRVGFAKAVNFFGDQFTGVINKVSGAMNSLFGTKLGQASFVRADDKFRDVALPMGFKEAFEAVGETRASMLSKINGFLDESTKSLRDLLGLNTALTGETNSQGTAMERLTRLWQDVLQRMQAAREAAKGSSGALDGSGAAGLGRLPIADLERQAKQKLLDLDLRRARVEGSFSLTDAQKFRERVALLSQEETLLKSVVAELEKRVALSKDEAEKSKAQSALDTFQGSLAAVQKERAGLGANPDSIGEQLQARIAQLQNSMGTLAQSVGNVFGNVFAGIFGGLSDAITGIIMGTKTAAQAFGQFGISVLTNFIQMIVQAILWAKLAVPILTALGVLTGGATAATGSAMTIAAVTSAVAATTALGAVNAATGGLVVGPGTGTSDSIPARLSNREFVIPNERVEEFGPGFFEGIRTGKIRPEDVGGGRSGSASGSSSASGGRAPTYILFDPAQFTQMQREHIEGIFIDMSKNHLA